MMLSAVMISCSRSFTDNGMSNNIQKEEKYIDKIAGCYSPYLYLLSISSFLCWIRDKSQTFKTCFRFWCLGVRDARPIVWKCQPYGGTCSSPSSKERWLFRIISRLINYFLYPSVSSCSWWQKWKVHRQFCTWTPGDYNWDEIHWTTGVFCSWFSKKCCITGMLGLGFYPFNTWWRPMLMMTTSIEWHIVIFGFRKTSTSDILMDWSICWTDIIHYSKP